MCGYSHKSQNREREFAAELIAQVREVCKNIKENKPSKLELGVLAPFLRNKDRLPKRLRKETRDGNTAARPAKRRQ
jgi:hypothetical protein